MIADPKVALLRINRYHTPGANHVFWDVPQELLLVKPKINIAENAGGGFEFTLSNPGEDTADNILSSKFNKWGDSSAASIRLGTFIECHTEGFSQRITEGKVSEIIPGINTVTIRVADYNSLMSSQGQTVYRNYTNEYTSNKISPGSWNGSNLIITKPADAAIASGAADWGVPTGKTYSDSPSRVVLLSKGASDPTKSYPAYGNIRTSDDVVHNVFFEVTSNSSKSGLYFDIDIIVTDGTNTYSKKQNINPPPNQTHTAMIDMNGLILRGNIDINISATRTASQTYTDYSVGVTQFGSSGDSAGVNGVSNKTITKNVYGIKYKAVTSGTTISATQYRVDAIQDVSTIDSSLFISHLASLHARLSYTTGILSTTAIQQSLLAACNFDFEDNSTAEYDTTVKEFRVGGGYLLDYLKVLSDISPDGNKCRSFRGYCFTGPSIPKVRIGNRTRKPSSTPAYSVCYGDEVATSGIRLQMYRHLPAQTIINRPSEIITKTKMRIGEENIPLIVTMTDWNAESSRWLTTTEYTAGNDVSTFGDAVSKAWSQLKANDVWEGTVTASGIHVGLIDDYGKGASISITDPRFSMDKYIVVVKEVRLDFGNQTTEIVYNNYSERHGGKIKSSGTMALFSANAVVDTDSDESLYATQYVRIVTQTKLTIKASNVAKAMTPGVGNIVQTVTNNNIYVIKYPDGARALFCIVFIANSTEYTVGPNDIVGVTFNDVLIDIPAALRPDLFRGQKLIVNIDAPI